MNKPKKIPNSSIKIAKIKSLWDSGIEYLSCPSPKPTPKKPPPIIADKLLATWGELSLDKNLSILKLTWSKVKYAKATNKIPNKPKIKKSFVFLRYKIINRKKDDKYNINVPISGWSKRKADISKIIKTAKNI